MCQENHEVSKFISLFHSAMKKKTKKNNYFDYNKIVITINMIEACRKDKLYYWNVRWETTDTSDFQSLDWGLKAFSRNIVEVLRNVGRNL